MKKSTKAKTNGKPKLLTRKELAAELGVVQDTITKWERAGLPAEVPGRRGTASLFSLEVVQEWRKSRDLAARDNGTVDLTRERARKERAQAIAAEQLVEVRAGELVRRADVEEVWTTHINAVRAKLLTLPTTLSDQINRAAELGGVAGVEKALAAAVNEVLLELADSDEPAATSPRNAKATKKKGSRKKAKRSKKARATKRKT